MVSWSILSLSVYLYVNILDNTVIGCKIIQYIVKCYPFFKKKQGDRNWLTLPIRWSKLTAWWSNLTASDRIWPTEKTGLSSLLVNGWTIFETNFNVIRLLITSSIGNRGGNPEMLQRVHSIIHHLLFESQPSIFWSKLPDLTLMLTLST